MSLPESISPNHIEMTEQAGNGMELEIELPREDRRLERNDPNADSSSNSDINSSEDGENNPALQLNKVPLEDVALDGEVEAINYSSTTTDIEKAGIPIAITITPAFGEIPDKTPKSEIRDGILTRKQDSLSPKCTYGAVSSSSRGSSPVPSFLGGEKDSMKASMKKVSEMVVLVAVIAVVWIVMLLPLVFYHLPQVSGKGRKGWIFRAALYSQCSVVRAVAEFTLM